TPVQGLSLFEDRERNLWVGLDSDGLLRLRETAVSAIGVEAGLPDENVFSVDGDGAGLWVGTSGGAAGHRNARGVERYGAGAGLASEWVNAIVSDGASGAWVGTELGGVQHIDGGA